MPVTIEAIVDRLGGPEAAARLTGVSTEAVRKWRQAGAVPSRHWAAVAAATGLTMDELQGEAPMPNSDIPPGATAALVLADGAAIWGRQLATAVAPQLKYRKKNVSLAATEIH